MTWVGLSSTSFSPMPTPTTFWSGATPEATANDRNPSARGACRTRFAHSFLALRRSVSLVENKVTPEVPIFHPFVSVFGFFCSLPGLPSHFTLLKHHPRRGRSFVHCLKATLLSESDIWATARACESRNGPKTCLNFFVRWVRW